MNSKNLTGVTIFLGLLILALGSAVFCVAATAQKSPGEVPDMTVDARVKTETIATLAKALRDRYVFPDVGDKMAQMLEGHQAHGDYNSISSAKEFAQLLTRQMVDIAHDRHLGVRHFAGMLPPPPGQGDQEEQQQLKQQLRKSNFRFERVEHLEGNIGYLKIDGFVGAPDPEGAAALVAAAMTFLTNTDALIIDLRQNGGGEPYMVKLVASYFFSGDKPVHLGDTVYRKPGTKEYAPPQEGWTSVNISGPRYVDKPVYILTAHRTFSGAEAFAYDLQAQKRTTIVGEVTGGGANPTGPVTLGDHFVAMIPNGYAVNPITKTNWEEVGIKPDIEVPAADALMVAQKHALEYLITKTSNEQEQVALKQALTDVDGHAAEQKHP